MSNLHANYQKAAYVAAARVDTKARARSGQQGLRDRFIDQVRSESPALPEDEVQRRAAMLYRAHFADLRAKAERKRQTRPHAKYWN